MTTKPLGAASSSTDGPRPVDAGEPRERTPWLLGFLCLLIPILPSFSVLPGPLKSNGSPAKLIAVLLFGLVMLGFVFVRRTASSRSIRPGVVIMLLYLLLQLAIYGVGLHRVDNAVVQGSMTRALINLVANVGVALYIIVRVRTARGRNFVLGCLATGLAFACLVGLLQSVANIDLRFLFQPPGFVTNSDELEMGERWGAKRVVGTSQHAIEFSVLAAVAVPLAIYFARNAAKRQVRWAAVAACGLALVSMPAAVSRTGIIALATAFLVYMWNFNVRQLAIGLAVGCTVLAVYIATFPDIAIALWNTTVASETDPSVLSRTSDYAMVSQTFREHPVFGLGLGATPPTVYGYLDNEFLQAVVQGGIVGVAAIMVLAAGGIFGIAAALRGATTTREREQAYSLGSIFIAIIVCASTFDLFNFQQVTRILFVIFGLLWSNFAVPLQESETAPADSHSDH
ncbi:O-antigen ligase family protein [Rhodococcus tukisamuensis]|uniref:O-antigen ligase n=1 Tax=Rhodococcus tukisamuensis TaxID=168276 RepID=A0A1G7AM63_9NOCA|nr:O-antigen ligase family protein [Rhodococcus tukisamuensis]SDE15800.1 O-antigen ligase [Rhodococcus tukisamuensis]